MTNANYIVSGFLVAGFSVKKDKIKLVLEADKDDIRAQDGTLGDILASLEAYASSEFPIEMTLGRCENISATED